MATQSSSRLPRPDLSDRPFQFEVSREMKADARDLYRAWTEAFDTWFAAPGRVLMSGKVDDPFWFETEHDGVRHPHYGRFLTLERDRVVELTWVTGRRGTDGAETVVRVELTAGRGGTLLRLAHSGFYDRASAEQHEQAWHAVLAQLDVRLAAPS